MLEMIAATTSLLFATATMPAMAPVAALPALVASTTQAPALTAVAPNQDANAANASPVDAIFEVHMSRGKSVTRHENGEVEYHPQPTTRMKLGLVGDKLTVCDSAGELLQVSDNGRCALATRSPDVSGKFALRHIVDDTYEIQYAGKTVSGQFRPREAVTFEVAGVNVGMVLYPYSEVADIPAGGMSAPAASGVTGVSPGVAGEATAVAPVNALLEVTMEKGISEIPLHSDSGVNLDSVPVTRIMIGLYEGKTAECDTAGDRHQPHETGRCAIARQTPEITGVFKFRHIGGDTYEIQYAGQRVSFILKPRQAQQIEVGGVTVAMLLKPVHQ